MNAADQALLNWLNVQIKTGTRTVTVPSALLEHTTPEGRDEARRLLPTGARVRLEPDVEARDQYGRLLAYVWVDSLMVNREMARRGMAVVLVYPPNVTHVEMLRAAVDSARAERRGLWSGSAFQCAPIDYRAGRCR